MPAGLPAVPDDVLRRGADCDDTPAGGVSTTGLSIILCRRFWEQVQGAAVVTMHGRAGMLGLPSWEFE